MPRTTLVLTKLGVITAPYLPVDVFERVEPATPYAATSIAVTVLWPQTWWATKKVGTWAWELCCAPVDAWIVFTDYRRKKVRQRKQDRKRKQDRSQDVPDGKQLTADTAEEQTPTLPRGETSTREAPQTVSAVPSPEPSPPTAADMMVE